MLVTKRAAAAALEAEIVAMRGQVVEKQVQVDMLHALAVSHIGFLKDTLEQADDLEDIIIEKGKGKEWYKEPAVISNPASVLDARGQDFDALLLANGIRIPTSTAETSQQAALYAAELKELGYTELHRAGAGDHAVFDAERDLTENPYSAEDAGLVRVAFSFISAIMLISVSCLANVKLCPLCMLQMDVPNICHAATSTGFFTFPYVMLSPLCIPSHV